MNRLSILVLAVAAAAFGHSTDAWSMDETAFRSPPRLARPHVWYHLMNGNVSKDGIRRDFETLAESGIGGVTLVDVGCGVPQGDVAFNSEEWFDIVEYAASEARRLGLELSIENCSGWSSSGGPWVTPDLAMKSLVWTETRVTGPRRFSGVLPRTEKDNGFYRDIAVVAFPTPPADISGRGLRIADAAKKTFAGRHKNDFRFDRLAKTPPAADGQAVCRESIVDVSGAMSDGGRMEWDVPEGNWTILRLGYICNGRRNHPATTGGRGLEIDKLSSAAAEVHFNRYIARICDRLGPLAGNVQSGLNAVLIDSHEVGCQNWTDGIEAAFEESVGYSMRSWMPVLAGRVVGDTDSSERFLEDFRRVVADLFARNFAGRYAELCHSRGLQLQIEPYGNCPSDDLQYGAAADVPMAEFWSRASLGDHSADTRKSRCAAFLAHVWGRRIAAAEAFTGDPAVGGRWLTTPFSIKAQCDRAYANGINRVVYHRFVHQPWASEARLPGMTMGKYGMHFDRTQTWWPCVRPWIEYQTRCQWMLQEGTFCADVLFYCGEEAPNGTGYDSQPLPGHGWDVCDTEALERLRVQDGRIVAPGAVSYALLALPGREFASERALLAVERLLGKGARICCGRRPTRAYGKPSAPDADVAVRAAAERIWSKGVMECSPKEALKRLGIAPDFLVAKPVPGAAYIHRRDSSADWYFVALNNETNTAFEASFREEGRIPEIWNAETGASADAQSWRVEGGRTVVVLDFPPSGSAFVVFRRKGTKTTAPAASAAPNVTAGRVSAPWRVTFPTGWYLGTGETKTVEWTELKDWSSDDDPDIRYFSGTATYRVSVPSAVFAPADSSPSKVVLDLGDVKNFADVTVNGKKYPPLWRPPYRVDITEAAGDRGTGNRGELDISIRVTNLWPNRLIGDDLLEDDCEWAVGKDGNRRVGLKRFPEWIKRGEASPTGRHTFTTWRHWTRDDALLPSGLLGPVRLECESATLPPPPSFSLVVRRNPNDEPVLVAASNAVSSTERECGGVVRHEWSFPVGSPVERAEATVRRMGDETRYRFAVKVADGWHLEKKSFPEVPCPLSGKGGARRWFMVGSGGGGYGHGCPHHSSNGDSAGAFAATWDDDEGVYFGVEDPSSENRFVGFRDIATGRVFREEVLGWRTGESRFEYDVVVRKVRRGARPLAWSDFCDIYREWGDRQTWSGKPLAERGDVPEWLKSGAAMTRFSRGWLEDPQRLERHLEWWRRTFGDCPVLAAIWGWEKLGTWYSPEYFPCHPDDDTFAKCVALMKKYGFHPFAWPSGYNWSETIGDLGGGRFRWDGRERWIRPNISHLALARDGSWSRKAFWLEDGSQTTLCGGDAWSADWFAGVARELVARGVEVVQIDQKGGGRMEECWNPAHGHELGNGGWQIATARSLLEKVRATKGLSAACNEFRNERLNDLVALQDIRDMETDDDCIADVFGYIHHGKVVTFQSNPRRNDLWQLAHMVAEGQMPFFEPQFENSMDLRPALKNGGFEEGTDNARGPDGWDRRPFIGAYLKGVDWSKPAWGVRGWTCTGWIDIATTWESKDVHSGNRAVRINHDNRGWLDYGNPIQLAQTVEGLEKGRYIVSCWVKGEKGLAEFKLGDGERELASIKIPSSGEWTRLELSAEAESELTVLFFAKLGAKFLLDDVRLQRDGAEVVQGGDTRWTGFYRRWISLYCGEASRFLVRGQRIRAPKVECAKVRIGGGGREVDAVCCAAYRADDGEEAVVLANGTWKEQKVELSSERGTVCVSVPLGGIYYKTELGKGK